MNNISEMNGLNYTIINEFILLGLSNLSEYQEILFIVFLVVYLLTVIGNLTIFIAIYTHSCLQKPMYYFLSNLSFLDICSTSVIVPRMLANFLTKECGISFLGCMVQLYAFIALLATEYFLLTAMAYDRYVAICNPLRYAIVMNRKFCVQMAGSSWTSGLLYSLLHTLLTSRLKFCGPHRISSFFCDLPPLLKLSCTETFINTIAIFAGGVLIGMFSFFFTCISYFKIISSVLKMNSKEGRTKAFSTCASHLTVFTLFLTSLIFVYLRPTPLYSLGSDRLVSLFYSVVTPFLNPVIYTLRNKEVQGVLRKAVSKIYFSVALRD
uniref:Olfactory receptor n=1 Tax=Geotrypetes seraphini TaxID=260995 RepID=A0A6P8Q2K6_GEOSA|nr:olfactory receptor 5V1-like [Geotrypetes seraphini]